MGPDSLIELVSPSSGSNASSARDRGSSAAAKLPAFQRLERYDLRGVTAFEIAYATHDPVNLKFRNGRGLQVHLRQRGTGRYRINGGGMIEGASTEMQIYCASSSWVKDVFETGNLTPRNIMFGLSEEAARMFLGATADAIFSHCERDTYHARVPMRGDLLSLMDDAFEADGQALSALRREARVLELLSEGLRSAQALFQNSPTGYRARPADIARLRAVETHIVQNLSADLGVPRMAALAGMSESRFRSLFHEVTGQPLVTYVRAARMKAAARLLRKSLPVGEVALAVGFEHAGHFSRVFREFHGVNPHKYAVSQN